MKKVWPTGSIAPQSSTIFKAFFVFVAVGLTISLFSGLVSLTRGVFTPYQSEVFLIGAGYSKKIQSPLQANLFYQFVDVGTDLDLIRKLKEFDLWSVQSYASIPPVVFNNFPDDLSLLPADSRKKIFFNSLLPTALIVHSEVEHEKKYLKQIIAKYDVSVNIIDFDPDIEGWQHILDQDEFQFINFVTRKYRTTKSDTLLNRVNPVPVSLILAQGAIESSWGTSRFAREANNLFGIWTWKEKGIIPLSREKGKRHKVASYPSLIDSVRAYCLNINRIGAYYELRSVRKETKDSMRLADKLYRYSQRGSVYVDEIKQIIRVNNLQAYDTCFLDEDKTL